MIAVLTVYLTKTNIAYRHVSPIKKEIYLTYADDVRSTGLCPVSRPIFSRMWKARFRNVIIPKVSTSELTNKILVGKKDAVLPAEGFTDSE